MKVEIKCPTCGKKYDVEGEFVGQKVVCDNPDCGSKFVATLGATRKPSSDLAESLKAISPPAKRYTKEDMERDHKSGIWRHNAFWIGLLALTAGVALWMTVIAPALGIKPVAHNFVPGGRDDPAYQTPKD